MSPDLGGRQLHRLTGPRVLGLIKPPQAPAPQLWGAGLGLKLHGKHC